MKETTIDKTNKTLSSPFITAYLVGGFPSKKDSIRILKEAVEAGLNVIEIGFPSKNPYLDGDTIKQAHKEAEGTFSDLDDFILYLKDVREAISIPVWIMGYVSDLLENDTYIKLAASSFIDGFIIPDMTAKQMILAEEKLAPYGVTMIPVVNSEMSDEEITMLGQNKKVMYCQLYAGKTGHPLTNTDHLPDFYQRMRNITTAKLMAGFGIKKPDIAGKIFEVGYDGIVVGSEFVRLIHDTDKQTLYEFINDLANAKKK